MKSTSALFPIKFEGLELGYTAALPLCPAFSDSLDGAGIHLIAGRNGSGKSTFIRTIAGLQKPLSGGIYWGDKDLRELRAYEQAQSIAFVSSTPPRSSGLQVNEVLSLLPSSELDRQRVLEEVDAGDWGDRRLSSLSDGQAQRVMLARALLQDTPWLALDEPTAFLDAPSRTAMWQTLTRLAQSGHAMLLASHDFQYLEGKEALLSVHAFTEKGWRDISEMERASEWEASL